MDARQAKRHGQQARRLGGQIQAGGVGAAHDHRQPVQGRNGQAEFSQHHVKAAQVAAVAEEHAFDVEGGGVVAFGHALDLGRGDEQDHRARIDKAADQPGTGDAVDLGPRARDPDRAALPVARRQAGRVHQRQPGIAPGCETTVKNFGWPSLGAQPGGRPLAAPVPFLAHRDHRPGRQRRQIRQRAVIGPDRARQQPGIGGDIRVGSDIQDHRRAGRADQPGQLVRRNRIRCRHGAFLPLKGDVERDLRLAPRGAVAGPMAGD